MTGAFAALAIGVALLGGATAAVAGFGIGSLLTPVLSRAIAFRLAIAVVAIPHLVGTGVRLWLLRADVDGRLLRGFGLASAAAALVGALLHAVVMVAVLGGLFGALLVVVGVLGITGVADRLRLRGSAAWVAGGASGFFGGLLGEQGGLRSAAMLGLGVRRDAFVATATAIALAIDVVRIPVYLATEGARLAPLWPLIAALTAGVLAGTLAGERVLRRIPERAFRRTVSALVLALGVLLVVESLTGGAPAP